MDYQTINTNGYNLYVMPSDKFSTVTVDLKFRKLIKKEDITKLLFLKQLLFRNNKVYPTARDVHIASEDNYVSRFDGYSNISGNYISLGFHMSYINDKYTNEDVSHKALLFMLDLVCKPDFFKQSEMDIVASDLENDILSLKEEPGAYAYHQLIDMMEPNSVFSYSEVGYLEDLKAITKEDLYNYYMSFLSSEQLDIFVLGDVESSAIKDVFDTYFTNRTNQIYRDSPYLINNLESSVKYGREAIVTNQSKLTLGFKYGILTEHEHEIILPLMVLIYGGGADGKLFKVVREKYSLCYNISASFNKINNFVYVMAGISASKYQQALDLSLMELTNIQNGLVSDEELHSAKKTIIEGHRNLLDNPMSTLGIIQKGVYYNKLSIEQQDELIAKVTIEEIVAISKKIQLDTVFLLEGVASNEETNI